MIYNRGTKVPDEQRKRQSQTVDNSPIDSAIKDREAHQAAWSYAVMGGIGRV
ncbi:hypothetical protein [Jonesia quinghaiensis]|uniref:hypothetical protein n=1 Tax=Jonesia quinghaiensis TaxID=262806 RepID=UPI0012F81F17|nr:hypothetical protein [Jonesia quinghaiensis]